MTYSYAVRTIQYIFSSVVGFFATIIISSTEAIRLSIPPSDGFKDIAVQWPQHIDSNGDLVYNYIQLANQYLRFSIIIICFAALVWLWFKLITNQTGSDEGKTALKNTILWAGAGIVVAMISYTVVRLVLNLI